MNRKLQKQLIIIVLVIIAFSLTGIIWGDKGPLDRFEEYNIAEEPPKRVFYVNDYNAVKDVFQSCGINKNHIRDKQEGNYKTPYIFFDVYYPQILMPNQNEDKPNDPGINITVNTDGGGLTLKKIPYSTINKIHEDNFKPEKNPDKFIQTKQTRMVSNSTISSSSKRASGKGQVPLMNGKSPNQVAYLLGLPDNTEYEWLHLSGRQFGGIDKENEENSSGVSGAASTRGQQVRNLVLGTKAANTQMIIYENIIADIFTPHLGVDDRIILNVTVECAKIGDNIYASWFATKIEYKCYLGKKKNEIFTPKPLFTTTFNPFEPLTPSIAEYSLISKYYENRANQLIQNKISIFKPEIKTPEKYAYSTKSLPYQEYANHVYFLNTKRYYEGWNYTINNINTDSLFLTQYQSYPYQSSRSFYKKNLFSQPSYPNIFTNTTYPGNRYMHNAVFRVTPYTGNKNYNPYKSLLTSATVPGTLFEYQTDGFVFSELLDNFGCEFVDQFVFDDVSIRLEQEQGEVGTDNIIVFEGTLRMDTEMLTTIGTFLNMTSGIRMSARINIGNRVFSGKIEPQSIILRSEADFNLTLTQDITLTRAALQLSIVKNIDYIERDTKWSFVPYVSGSVQFSNLQTVEPVTLDFLLSYSHGTLHASAFCDKAEGLFGIDNLTLENFQANFDIGNEDNIDVSGYISTTSSTYGLGGKISPDGSGLYVSVDQFSFDDLNELFTILTQQTLTLPDFDVQFSDVLVGIASDSCSIGEVFLDKGITLQATVSAHGYTCSGRALISRNMVSFTGELGSFDFNIVHIHEAFVDMRFYAGVGAEFSIGGRAIIQGIDLVCKVNFEKYQGQWNCVLYGALEGDNLRFSTVFPAAQGSFMDCLSFSKAAFVIALKDCKTQDPDYSFTVRKGLQLMAVLEEIPVLSQLTGDTQVGLELCAYFGSGIDITIALPDTRLYLGDFIETDPFKIRISLLPPSFSLIFGMNVMMINQTEPLHFDVVLDLGILEASGSATIKGYWENPFGIQGLRIGPELALEIGINYAQFASTLTPSTIAIVGGMAVGDVEAQMAFSISTTSAQQILMGKLSQLSPQDMVKFANTLTQANIPLDQIPNFIEFSDIDIYIAPLGGSIGTINFEPGITLAGQMVCFGKSAAINAHLNDTGFVAKGHIDQLEIGPLKIHGKRGENAELDIELTAARQSIFIDGEIEFFNYSVGVFTDISFSGVEFEFEQKMIDILYCKVHGKSEGSLDDLSSLGFTLSGELTLAENHIDVNGALHANGTFFLQGDANITLAGINLANANVNFSNSGISLSGQVHVGSSYVMVDGEINSDGSFSLDGSGNLTISGFSLASAQVACNNNGIVVSGKVNVAGSRIDVSGSVNSSGAFSLTGSGNLSMCGFSLSSATVNFNNNGIAVSGKVNVGGTGVDVCGSINSSGAFSLAGSGNLSICGFSLSSAAVTFNNNGIAVNGKVNVGGSWIDVNGSVNSSGAFTFTGNGNVGLAGYSLANAQITFSNSGISGSGTISYSGITFSVTFSAATDGRVNGSGSVNVGPFSLGAFGIEVGSLSGTMTLSVSNNVISTSFSGNLCIMGACSNLRGRIGTDGVIAFTTRVCLYLPVAGVSCSTQCTNVCLPSCYWGSSCGQVCLPFLGCSTVCTPVLLCPIVCNSVCVNVCVPVINMVYTCADVGFSVDLF